MNGRTLVAALGIAAAALLLQPPTADAQVYGGVQANWGSEFDFGVGGRVLGNVETANLELVGDFNLYFPDGDRDFWEANGNVFYHFHLPESPQVLPYVGGGLNVSRLSTNGADNTEAGLNLGGGVRFPLENVSPFIEGRAVISDHDQAVLTVGVIFGHAHFTQ